MVKAKIPITTSPVPAIRRRRTIGTASNSESSLLMMRLKELDREFARQTKQLTALTRRLGKKLTEPHYIGKGPKK